MEGLIKQYLGAQTLDTGDSTPIKCSQLVMSLFCCCAGKSGILVHNDVEDEPLSPWYFKLEWDGCEESVEWAEGWEPPPLLLYPVGQVITKLEHTGNDRIYG